LLAIHEQCKRNLYIVVALCGNMRGIYEESMRNLFVGNHEQCKRNLWNAGNLWAIYILLPHFFVMNEEYMRTIYEDNLWEQSIRTIYYESMNFWQWMSNLWAIWYQSMYCCHIFLSWMRNIWSIYELLAMNEQWMKNLWRIYEMLGIYEQFMRNMRGSIKKYESNLYIVATLCCHEWRTYEDNLWGQSMRTIYESNMISIYVLLPHFFVMNEEYMINLWIAGNEWAMNEESIYCYQIMLLIYEQSINLYIVVTLCGNMRGIYEESTGNLLWIYEFLRIYDDLWGIYDQYESNLYIVVTLCCHEWGQSMRTIHEDNPWGQSMRTIHEDNPWGQSMRTIHYESMNCWQWMSNEWRIYEESMRNTRGIYILLSIYGQSMINLYIVVPFFVMNEESMGPLLWIYELRAIYEQSMNNLWTIYGQSMNCCHIMWRYERNQWTIYEEFMSNISWIYEQWIEQYEESKKIYEQSINYWHIMWRYEGPIYMSNISWIHMSNIRGIYEMLSHYESQSMCNERGNQWRINEESMRDQMDLLPHYVRIYEQSIYWCHNMSPIYEKSMSNIYCRCHIMSHYESQSMDNERAPKICGHFST
jgi:hypothetical protein